MLPTIYPPRTTHWRRYQLAILLPAALCSVVGLLSLWIGNPEAEASVANWSVPAYLGLQFTMLGALKFYELPKSDAGKPVGEEAV